ncbi:MAG: response regulator [bacterium]|nr:response regulator [bacterium]
MSDDTTSAEPETPPLKILLVEDDEFDVAVFGRAFRQSEIPIEIIRCRSGEEALDGLRQADLAIDLLVADHQLPGMTGFDLCLELLEDEPPYALVLLTGGGSEQMAIRALRAGIHDYIVKDTSQEYLDLLPLVLPRVVRRHRARRAQKAARTPGQPTGPRLDLADFADLVRHRGGRIWFEGGDAAEPSLHFSVPLAPAEADTWRPEEGAAERRRRDRRRSDREQPGQTPISAETDTPGMAPEPSTSAGGRPERVLIAHANSVIRFVAARAAERLGYRFTAVETGDQALEALERERFDVVLMGARMPGLDGFETTREIRGNEPETGDRLPIVALGVDPDSDEGEACLAAGMDGRIARPVAFENVSAALLRSPRSEP